MKGYGQGAKVRQTARNATEAKGYTPMGKMNTGGAAKPVTPSQGGAPGVASKGNSGGKSGSGRTVVNKGTSY